MSTAEVLYPSNGSKNTNHFELFITLTYKKKSANLFLYVQIQGVVLLFKLIGKTEMLSITSIISDAQKSFISKSHLEKHCFTIQLHKKHTF